VRTELDDWLTAAAIDRGKLFRRVNKVGRTWGDGMTVKAVWHIVKESARRVGVAKLAPHDLRRTCARLCHASGGELEQIQFLLGHVSVQTEKVPGKEKVRIAACLLMILWWAWVDLTTDLALISIEAVSASARNAGFFEGHGRLRRYPLLAVFLLLGFDIRLHDEDAAHGL
jgi:hypothetical protein